MSDNPNATEDLGYSFVQRICAQANAIWRRQAEKDVGIDGIIEFKRVDGVSAYVGVQVKSGASYLKRRSDHAFRIRLGKTLGSLYRYAIPVILVVYDPDNDVGYWSDVKAWVDHYERSPDNTMISVEETALFTKETLDELRRDTHTVKTPEIARETIREFLNINSGMSYIGFVELAKHALNGTSFRCKKGVEEIEYLRDRDLLRRVEAPDGGLGLWSATPKGKQYIQFMLGDRYFIPFLLTAR